MQKLKRVLRFRDVLIFGIGIIIGAGIYTIIGKVAGIAGYSSWISVILAGILSLLTGLSFAEMASIYPDTSTYYKVIRDAFKIFGGRIWGFIVQWSLILVCIFAISTVSIAFGGYFSKFIPLDETILSALIIILAGILSYLGIKESVSVTLFLTFSAIFGLALVIMLGIFLVRPTKEIFLNVEIDKSVFYGAGLIFFAYAGFELIPAESEETKAPKKIIPKAVVFSILICMVIYTLVCIAALNLLDIKVLESSNAPLFDAVSKNFGNEMGYFILFSAIFATSSTILGLTVSGSRLLYSFGKEKLFPKIFSKISKRKTPFVSISLISFSSLISMFLVRDLRVMAEISNFLTIFCFYLVNISIILLRIYQPKIPRGFKVPFSFKNIPIPSLIASLFCLSLLSQFPTIIIFNCFLIILLGIIFYFIIRERYIL
ncbi:MAG: APC family permease [Candidatus Aenigmatarchaeota archaeon]